MNRRAFIAALLNPSTFRHYVETFNATYAEDVVNLIPDSEASAWMSRNIPLFTCPDRDFELTWYYRWWAFRKHIKQTPAGIIITEFLKPVSHAGQYNALSCALGHHIAEGRWLHDQRYVDEDIRFWLRSPNLHQFSGWTAAAIYERYLADGRRNELTAHFDSLLLDYEAWERERLTPSGLFWQRDVSEGMEESISGGRRVRNIRPSINSYMCGNAEAIAKIAALAGQEQIADTYRSKAAKLQSLIYQQLWNKDLRFFDTRLESAAFAGVRENIGFTPWLFNLPKSNSGFESAWKQLMDPQGFYAPYGPTTAERRHPGFRIAYEGDDCQWNGPSWPFATTITLRALANVDSVRKQDYFETLRIYTRSQRRKLDDGRVVPWIDENLNPFAGEWLARERKRRKPNFTGRGDHYNHSGYCDLIITGLCGLRPRADDIVEINPLLPSGTWDWFCLDRVPYHGRMLTILWDRTGKKFSRGRGLILYANNREIARAPELRRLTARLYND